MAEAHTGTQDLRYELRKPADIANERWDEIVDLRTAYYERTLVGRTSGEIEAFVASTARASWDDPNASELRGGYSRAVVSAAFDSRDALVGFEYVAHNASSNQQNKLLNRAERVAKLYIPSLVDIPSLTIRRYHWRRESVDNGEGRPGLREALTALAIRHQVESRQQPMSQWLFGEEHQLRDEVLDWGLRPTTDPEPRPVFGSDSHPTTITMYKADSAYSVFDDLLNKPHAQAAIGHAFQSLEVRK